MAGPPMSPVDGLPRLQFLNLDFVDAPMPEVVEAVRLASAAQLWTYLVTPNSAHLDLLGNNPDTLGPIWRGAGFLLLDSQVVRGFARLLLLDPPRVLTGSDLCVELFESVIGPATKVHVVCANGRPVEEMALARGLHRLTIAVPPMGLVHDPDAMRRVAEGIIRQQADFTFIAVGAPQQEMLAAMVGRMGGGRGIGVCIGAGLDFITGVQKRAPRWMRRIGLEWAYRFAREPRRLAKRYLIESPRGMRLVLRAALRRRRG